MVRTLFVFGVTFVIVDADPPEFPPLFVLVVVEDVGVLGISGEAFFSLFSTGFAGTALIGASTVFLFDCGVTFFVIVGGGFLRGGVTVANRIVVLFAIGVVDVDL